MTEHFHQAVDTVSTPIADRVGLVVASGAVVSPFWLPTLKSVSEIAATIAPILGCTLLLLQIAFKIAEQLKRR